MFVIAARTVFTNVEVQRLENILAAAKRKLRTILLETNTALATQLITNLCETADTSMALELEDIIGKSDKVDDELKKKALKLTITKEAKQFKEAYTEFHKLQHIPTRIIKELGGNMEGDNGNVVEEFCNGEKCAAITRHAAVLAVAQNAFRTARSEDDRQMFLKSARECEAVVQTGANMPPKFALLMEGKF